MQPIYEIINSKAPLYINLFLHKVSVYPMHWHKEIELLLILDGEAKIIVSDNVYMCKENDLLAININEPHSIFSQQGVVMLALHLQENQKYSGFKYEVNSVRHPENNYDDIKSIMARMIKLHSEAAPNSELLIESLILKLRYELLSRYSYEVSEEEQRSVKYYSKLEEVIEYIQDHYHKNITLKDTADKFYYSNSYLSRLFEKTMGITFKKYIDNLRLSDAVNLLLSTDKSIEEIASECGFSNTRSFVSLHKEEYGCLPTEHRKKQVNSAIHSGKGNDNYLDFKKTDYLSKLAKYVVNIEKSPEVQPVKNTESIYAYVDTEKPVKSLKHTFKKFCSVGRASDILKQNVRNMLIELQNEVKFEYIKFHGLFDDDLSVFAKTADGRIVINFDAIDNIIDFLLTIRLKPLMQLSFMPKALAKYPEKTTFFRPIVMSEPNNNDDWVYLVKKLISHLLSRYGQETVQTWLFCVWNEPETPPSLFGFNDPSLFKDFYRITYHAVKDVCPVLKFGSSSLMSETILNTTYFEDTFLSDDSCYPDFVNFHFYPLSSSALYSDSNLENPVVKLESNPYIMSLTIEKLRAKLNSLGAGHLPLYLTEWNSTTSHRDLLNDTAFKGAYVARNIIDNYDNLDSFGYWTLTDDILELPLVDNLFHGGIGLFTKSGIKKPPYYAFKFLAQLGDNLLDKNKGYIITEDRRGFQILLVNYIHYSDIYSAGELFDLTSSNRYAAFRSERELEFNIDFDHSITGNYVIEEYSVNRKNGSCFDVWIENFNNEEPSTPESMLSLKHASHPKYTIKRTFVDNGILHYHAILEAHEIRLIKIKRL